MVRSRVAVTRRTSEETRVDVEREQRVVRSRDRYGELRALRDKLTAE